VRGFPGSRRRPEAFAYVELKNFFSSEPRTSTLVQDSQVASSDLLGSQILSSQSSTSQLSHSQSPGSLSPNSQFPEVKRVSVKTPLSDNPPQDHLLVGTFWFKNKSVLEKALNQLITQDHRVNGELYLDSIFNVMIEQGLKVRIISLDGYINWGDPDSLAEALYWKEVFFGHRLSKRQRLEGVSQ
jgi:hypothetical protein